MCQDKSFRTYGNLERIIDWKRRGEENDVKVLTLRTQSSLGSGFFGDPVERLVVPSRR